jgi:hypothetical protein
MQGLNTIADENVSVAPEQLAYHLDSGTGIPVHEELMP